MAKKDSVIFYQEQIKICKKHMTSEQFGRLMIALFELDDGGDPEVDEDIAMAFEFMSLQQKIDKKKYDEMVERNRKNGSKGGAPKGNQNARKTEKQHKTTQNKPNDKRMIREENDKRREENDSGLSLFGSLSNVELTPGEYESIVDKYEDPDELIDRVSRWLPNAKHDVPDHYEAILNYANKSGLSKRRILKPPPPEREIDPEDMLTEEEQAELVANLKRKIGFNVIG